MIALIPLIVFSFGKFFAAGKNQRNQRNHLISVPVFPSTLSDYSNIKRLPFGGSL